MESYKPETVGKPTSKEKHSSWFTNMKEAVNKDVGFKTLALGISLVFAQQEAQHHGTNGAYDFKSKLGYGLATRNKEVEDLEDISATTKVYESKV